MMSAHPPATMRRVMATQLGPPDHYVLVEQPIAPLAPDEVLLRIRAVSLGHADILVSAGRYQVTPALPFVPGSEGSGTVVAVGTAVMGFAPGTPVTVTRPSGVLADHVVAKPAELAPMPEGMSFAEAAAYRSNYATALHALQDRGALRPGETLLVLGSAGGVGIAAVQIGKRLGARVIAGASTEQKRRFACEQGADLALDYSIPDWRGALKAMTGGRGIDLVFDPVGGTLFEPAFRSLAWGGRHLVVGFVGGPIPRLPANLALLKGAALVGVDIRQFALNEPERHRANLACIDAWCTAGLRPPLGRSFDFTEFRAAMVAASHGTSLGKVVVEIDAIEPGA